MGSIAREVENMRYSTTRRLKTVVNSFAKLYAARLPGNSLGKKTTHTNARRSRNPQSND